MQNNNIEAVKNTVQRLFPNYWVQTEACLATVATLLLESNSNPTSLVLVGQPSSGKTTVLDFFDGNDEIFYKTDHFTARAFVSHYANKNKDDLKGIDLLSRIKSKCLVVPDLGVILGKRHDDVSENLGILTRALDGNGLKTDSGVWGQRQQSGDFMFTMLCGTTPFGYKLWDAMSTFGGRMLFLNMLENHNNSVDDIVATFTDDIQYGAKKAECQKVMNEFLSELWRSTGGFRSVKWNCRELPQREMKTIVNLARLLSKLRAMIVVWDNNGDYQHKTPSAEDCHRAVALFLNIAKGRAIIHGRSQINLDDIPLLIDITLSSCPKDRGMVFRGLLKEPKHCLSTSDICIMQDSSPKMAIQVMENLRILGLVEYLDDDNQRVGRPGKVIALTDEWKFFLEPDFLELFSKSALDR